MRIAGHEDKRALRGRAGAADIPRLTLSAVRPAAARAAAMEGEQRRRESRVAELEGFVTASKELGNFTLHEIRRLNAQLKSQSESLSRMLSDGSHEWARDRADNLFATSTLISIRLDAYDLEVNPEQAINQHRRSVGVYSKFDKCRHVLRTQASARRIKVLFDGESHSMIDAFPIFDLLPYVLLENAIKYSPDDQTIALTFEESRGQIRVQLASYGPTLEAGEWDRVFDRGFRGKHASARSPGSGLGLFVAQRICHIHGISISARSGPSSTAIDSVPYSEFVVDVLCPR